jgi:hypothetical protein
MADAPAIMFVKPGAISPDDKAVLREAGVIVVETNDPDAVRLVQAGHDLPSSALLAAAGKAVQASEIAQAVFGITIAEALELQFSKKS